MSERFKEPVLKTGDGVTHRGFESHSLRQKTTLPDNGGVVFSAEWGFERMACPKEGQETVWRHALRCGRIRRLMNVPGMDVRIRLFFIVEQKKSIYNSVFSMYHLLKIYKHNREEEIACWIS